MNFNIAVTGVGGGVGQSILKSLQNTGYNLVAMDGEVLGTGLYASMTSYLIPFATHADFITVLLDICKKEKIALLFPGLDAELMILSKNKDIFKEIGCTVVVSEPSVIDISDNKQQTYNELSKLGIAVPFTVALNGFQIKAESFPLIIKQKEGGARSRNVFPVRNDLEWSNVLDKIGDNTLNFVVQEYIEGEEYTCGSINFDGKCKGVIVMRRILRDGDTYKCFTESNSLIEAVVRNVTEAIKPFGACNVQLRIKNGIAYVFEINARCSGTTGSRTLAGFNEPLMVADYLLKGKEPSFDIKEITVLRYWNELVVDNAQVEKMAKEGKITNPVRATL